MKHYQYQILRYIPDRINEEFVNVGLVFYAKDEKYLRSSFVNRSKRMSSFFNGLNVHHIMQSINHLQKELNALTEGQQRELAFSVPDSIERITSRLMVKDDTALVFSDVYRGIDVSLDSAFESLSHQMIFRYDSQKKHKTTMSDEDVWKKVYQKYFKEKGVESRLSEHVVKTEYSNITFSKAWKNQKWHCYEPVSFDLKRKEDVKNKVLHWSGILKWLETSTEPVKVELLSVLPQNKELRQIAESALKNQRAGQSSLNLISEDEAEAFARQLELDFREHR